MPVVAADPEAGAVVGTFDEGFQDLKLQRVRVLILIDQQMKIALCVLLPDGWVLMEQTICPDQEVVEVIEILPFLLQVVALVDVRYLEHGLVPFVKVLELLDRDEVVLCQTDLLHHHAEGEILDLQVPHDVADENKLVSAGEDLEDPPFATKQVMAEAVDGAQCDSGCLIAQYGD